RVAWSGPSKPAVAQTGKASADLVLVGEVDASQSKPVVLAAVGDDGAPRVDHERMPVAGPLAPVEAPLRRGEDVALVLDGPRPQEHVPVILPRLAREGAGHGDHPGAARG